MNEYTLSVKYLNLINATTDVTTDCNIATRTCKLTKNANNPKIPKSFACVIAT